MSHRERANKLIDDAIETKGGDYEHLARMVEQALAEIERETLERVERA